MAYPFAIQELLDSAPLAPLGPGTPSEAVRSKIAAAVATLAGRDRDAIAACRAGLYLAFDHLDASHAISQELETVEGSYWHALMHRREPDYGNSKYWFRRVGRHVIFSALAEAAATCARAASVRGILRTPLQATSWDPFAFVDLCEQAAGGHEKLRDLCREVQRIEWQLLFDHCLRLAEAT